MPASGWGFRRIPRAGIRGCPGKRVSRLARGGRIAGYFLSGWCEFVDEAVDVDVDHVGVPAAGQYLEHFQVDLQSALVVLAIDALAPEHVFAFPQELLQPFLPGLI